MPVSCRKALVFILGLIAVMIGGCNKAAPQFPFPSLTGNTPSPNATGAGQSLGDARQLIQQNNNSEAEKVLLGIISREPNNIDARSLLGGLYMNEGKPGPALQQFQEIYRITHDPHILTASCWAYSSMRDWKAAEADCEAAVKMKPDLPTYRGLGNLYRIEKKPEKAIHAYQKALKYPGYDDLREDIRRSLQALQGK